MDSIRLVPKVFIPADLVSSDYVGDLFGFYHSDSDIYNVVAWGEQPENHVPRQLLRRLGSIVSDPAPNESNELVGRRVSGRLAFDVNGKKYEVEPYNIVQNIFSRNTGILETDWMLSKTAFILGCGSVGSLLALELARAGVGNFVLVDNDVLGYHNLCRHQCGIEHVGQFKAVALKERIVQINPTANVEAFVSVVERLEKSVFDQHGHPDTVLIGCADNREADLYAGRIAETYRMPFVSVGFWERAFAGEIFYSLPDHDHPCYECALGSVALSSSNRVSTNRRIYTNQEELAEVNFEPGISADINFVTIVAVKLILDILNRGNDHYTPRLINYLTQYTLVCNTNDTRVGGDMAEVFSYPLQVTRSIKVSYQSSCPPCKYR